jgi:hypothetical protein
MAVGLTVFGLMPLGRYVCCKCGFTEQYVEYEGYIETLKRKFKKPPYGLGNRIAPCCSRTVAICEICGRFFLTPFLVHPYATAKRTISSRSGV